MEAKKRQKIVEEISQLEGTYKDIVDKVLHARGRIKALLPDIKNITLRGKLLQDKWELEKSVGMRPGYFSRGGQDWWLDQKVFKGKRGGTFVELGGFDGLIASNCLFFELMRGWDGLLLEPSPSSYRQAATIRRCTCLQRAIAASSGEAEFLEVTDGYLEMSGLLETFDSGTRSGIKEHPQHQERTIKVPTISLADLLGEHALEEVDYISMDVEGTELDVIESFPSNKFRVRAWTIENKPRNDEIAEAMRKKGYKRVEMLGGDDVFLLADEFPDFASR